MKQILFLFLISFFILNVELCACSIVSVKSENDVFIGRNFDWYEDGGEICFFKKASTYVNSQKIPSYAHFILHQYGESMPFDGINEFGLFIGITAINSIRADASFSFLKKSTTSLGILKKVLERSRSVEQAINIFKEYNLLFGNFLGFPMIHYLVSDKGGDSAIIEYVDGALRFIKKDRQNFQIMTNFLLTEFPPDKAIEQKLFYRYRLATSFLEQIEQYSVKDVRNLIQMISLPTSVMPRIKMVFDEDKKYSFDDIQKIYLIDQAMPSEAMEPFSKTKSYSSEEIVHTITDYVQKKEISRSQTIWSSIYSIKPNEINIEVYYKRNWKNPKKFNFTKKIKNMEKQIECYDLVQIF